MRARRSLLAVLTATLLMACGGREAELVALTGTTTGAGMEIDLRGPADPREGDNTFEVAAKKDGVAVTDASVTLRFSMPAMPAMNMPEMHSDATLERTSAGVFRGTGHLSMAGTWNVHVKVARGSEELGTKTLSIVAR